MHSEVFLSSSYLAPIQVYSVLKNNVCIVDTHEHYVKQTYRSRCEVYSPQGILTLSVPLQKRRKRQAMHEIKIAFEYDWQKLHWRSIESCYRRSPFFEFYEDDLSPFFNEKKFNFLIDLNEALQQLIISLLKLKVSYTFSTEYLQPKDSIDYRAFLNPKSRMESKLINDWKLYHQVFASRHQFIPNLSIIDLLFNEGPRAIDFL